METKNNPVQWLERIVHLKDLTPFERNPRTITEAQFKKLKQSLSEDGYHSRIKVTHDMRVIGGHQRLRALTELGFTEVPVLVPDREISDDQFKRIVLRDNHSNGVFDMDMLADDFDLEELRDIGLHEIMNIAPVEDSEPKAGKHYVACPKCEHVFPIKGNKAEA